VVRIVAYYARGCGFDPRTLQIFVCINMSVFGAGCFQCMYIYYIFTTSIEARKRCYSFVLARTPLETRDENEYGVYKKELMYFLFHVCYPALTLYKLAN
jgi:hypothetical protein